MCYAQCDHNFLGKHSKLPYMAVLKLANRNVLWSFLLLPSLVTLFGLWNFIADICMYAINKNLSILLYFSMLPLYTM